MGRAIAAISGTAIAFLPRPLGLYKDAMIAVWREMTRNMSGRYRPERHYMRGPGPKYRVKHDLPPL